jgi:hypothetical protein
MAAYLIALDCFDDAREHASQALEAARDMHAPVLTAFVLQHVAAVAALQGDSAEPGPAKKQEQATMLLGFVEARLSSLGVRRDYTEWQEYERVVAALRSALGERLDKLMALGAQWSEEDAAATALDL